MTESLEQLRKNRAESAARLRKTLDEIPGARAAFQRVLEDPMTKESLEKGVGIILGLPSRAKVVGWLVAIAEINDREIRMAAARAIQEAIAIGKQK